MKVNYLDLFSGIGGFSKGLQMSGVEFGWHGFSEIDKYAISVYRRHFPDAEPLGSITDLDWKKLPKLDLVTYGYPCQDLSIAGKRRGLDGKRSGLFFNAMDIIKNARPHYFVWENVAGLLSSKNGKDIEAVETEMFESGYIFDYDLQNTSWYLPQNRLRVYCIGVDLLWIAKELNEDAPDGRQQMIPLYENIVKGFLLSKLQQNLEGQQRPHEVESVGLVLNWLITQKLMLTGQPRKSKYLEIIRAWDCDDLKQLYHAIPPLQSKQKSTKLDASKNQHTPRTDTGCIMNGSMDSSELLESIGMSLNALSEENLIQANKCIMSIMTKRTMHQTTFTFAEVENIIWLCIDKLKNSYKDLWGKALLDLMGGLESTRYAEIGRDQAQVPKTDDTLLLPFSNAEGFGNESIGYPGKGSRPQVFPIGEGDDGCIEPQTEEQGHGERVRGNNTQNAVGLRSRDYKGGSNLLQVGNVDTKGNNSIWGRVYDPTGIATTLTDGGGMGAKTGLYCVPVLTPDRMKKRQNGRRFKEDGEPSFTLTGQDIHGVIIPKATAQGYAITKEGDSINLSNPNSATRRGRVGVGVANTIDTQMQQYTPVCIQKSEMRLQGKLTERDIVPTLKSETKRGDTELLIIEDFYADRIRKFNECPTLRSDRSGLKVSEHMQIRKLTPRECERLQGFPDDWTRYGADGKEISDSQRYKMCGNAVTTKVVQAVMERLFKEN